MKPPYFTAVALLPVLVVGRAVLPASRLNGLINATSPIYVNDNHPSQGKYTPSDSKSVQIAGDNDLTPWDFWWKYLCRGSRLHEASIRSIPEALEFASPLDTPFDSTLESELKRWGYLEHNSEAAAQCWFNFWIPKPLHDLNIDAMGSDMGGPNRCFWFEHWDRDAEDEHGPIPINQQFYEVDGRWYRATNSYAVIGVNAKDGVIYFLNVRSALEGAKSSWKDENPPLDELPALRSISDMAWGAWHRMHPDGQGLNRINKFFVDSIVNPTTNALIKFAVNTYELPYYEPRPSSLPKWPGLTFSMDTDQGAALLGSPNGIAVAYFVAQHKRQLGGNKYVEKVQVFMNDVEDDDEDEWPYMIFWVADGVAHPKDKVGPRQDVDSHESGKVVARSADGRNILHEHVFRARL